MNGSEAFCSFLCPDHNCRDRDEGVEPPNPFHAICSLGELVTQTPTDATTRTTILCNWNSPHRKDPVESTTTSSPIH